MENQYGIATKNRFLSMVDIDDDPIEFLKQQEAVKTKKEKAPKSKQSGKKAAAQSEAKVKEQNVQKKEEKERVNSAKPNERGGGRGGRREPREIRENDGDRRPPRRQGPKEFRENRGGDENVPPEFRDRPEGSSGGFGREGGERGRGRGRGRGGFRGGRGRGGFRNDGDRGENRGERQGFGAPPGERKRDFDRHSGSDKTGIKAVEKKDGGGARNWGSYRDDIPEPQETEERAPAEESTETFELNESGEADPAVEVEDQPKQMTLDEWKALQKTERTKPTYKLRKAGEGEEGSQWKGTAYTKKKVNSDGEEDEEEEDDDEDEKRHGNKNLLDIKITFNDPVRRGRGGRRPRDSRGRGRGSGRGERKPRDSAPRMDDETDFPRLVKTAA